MAESRADRYCRNCGHELRQEDRFCPGCGRPVRETAHVPTPDADVLVPPPPSSQQAEAPSWGRSGVSRFFLIGGFGVVLVLVLLGVGLAALAGAGGGIFFAGEQEEAVGGAEQQPGEEPSGYVLLPEREQEGGYAELLFLQFVREGAEMPGGGQAIRGYLTNTTPFYELGLPVARVQVNTIEGTATDEDLQFNEELVGSGDASYTYYYGTIEGSRMELTRDIPGARTTWVGQEGTLEDYHEEVEKQVEEVQELPAQ